MASFTLDDVVTFPQGTTVAVYDQGAKRLGAAPSGTQVTSAAMGASNVTFTGLTVGSRYTAYALVSSEHRYVDFEVVKSDLALRRERFTGIRLVEVSVNLPSIAVAPSAVNHDVTLPAGSCKVGDGVCIAQGDAALNAGILIQGVHVQATDTVRMRVSNTTAGAIDPAAATMQFLIVPA